MTKQHAEPEVEAAPAAEAAREEEREEKGSKKRPLPVEDAASGTEEEEEEEEAVSKKRKVKDEDEETAETSDVVMESDGERTESENEDAKVKVKVKHDAATPLETAVSVERAAFHRALAAGAEADVYCVRSLVWLPAKIEKADDAKVRVHFMGWNKKSDENIALADLFRVAPRGAEAADAWKAIDDKQELQRLAREKKKQEAVDRFVNGSAKPAEAAAPLVPLEESVPAVAFVEAGATRSGRRITKRLATEGTTIVRKTLAAPASSKQAAEKRALEVQEDNLCGMCGEYEDDVGSDMILCDGGCLNSYHFSCIGIEEAPEEGQWFCEQCRTNEQLCFMCGRNGTINERGGVFRCSVVSCGKFYHQQCVDSHKHFRRFGRAKAAKENGAEDDEDNEPESSFRCPRHVCGVCENSKKAELMQCLKCPEAYHPHCVPPSARYNNLGMLCYRHPTDTLPRIPAQYLTDRNFDSVVVDSNLRLPALFLPKKEPDENDANDCHHFRMQLSLMDDVKKVPPTFRKLTRSIYTFKQVKESLEDVPMCVCKVSCGDDCINRLSFTECFGPAPTHGQVPLKASERREKEANCPLGENCGNRALHQRTYPKFERFHSVEKGWGLKVVESVKAGQLVIEYVGEVIDEKEKDRRLSEHARLHPDDNNMYIMELSKGVYIDAREKGSVSRFINHSCDPNCRLLKWNVKGVNRIAITAIKDIPAGEELSYDYQFHTSSALKWRCFCKSANCRGTMAPERLNTGEAPADANKKLSKKEMKQQLKRAVAQEKLNQKKDEREMAKRLSLTAAIGRVSARRGPVTDELTWAKDYHLFLRRNARRGYDFLQRRQLVDARIRKVIATRPVAQQQNRAEDSASTASTEEEITPIPPPTAVRLAVVPSRKGLSLDGTLSPQKVADAVEPTAE